MNDPYGAVCNSQQCSQRSLTVQQGYLRDSINYNNWGWPESPSHHVLGKVESCKQAYCANGRK